GWSLSGIVEHAQSTPVVGSDTSDTRWWLFLRYEFGGGGAFRPFDDSAAANAAWIDRALHEPVTGHARNVDTYVTKGKTTTTTTLGSKQYSARVPTARDDAVSVVEGSSATAIDVLGNDTDPDNNALVVSAAGPAAHGTVQVATGQVQYTPTAGYTGTDTFPYTITNSKGLSASATVHVTVTSGTPPPNSGGPVARDDTTTTPFAQPVTVAVLGNDSDPNGYPLTVTAATTPAHGSSHVNGDGTITYTPNATFTGSDRFTYSIDNAHGGTASANVTIVVQPPAPPQARDDSATTAYGNAVDIDVLANDTDPAGYPLTVSSVTSPSNGTAIILTNGAVRYRPVLGFTGNDTFSYTVSDGHGGVAGANVAVTVLPQSGTFRARDDSATTAYATPVTIDVLANDSAPTGAKLTIKNVTTPQHGTAANSPAGVVYTPSAAFNGGTDTFDYTVGDGLETLTATVTVKVLPPGNPVAQNDQATTAFATPVVVNVLANDSDPNHFPLTVSSISAAPAHGIAQINGDNTITYTPASNYSGSDNFSYAISNNHGGTASANVTVTVQAALPPVARADGASTAYNTPVTITVLANDSDPNGLVLSIAPTPAPAPAHGSAQINANNTITYTPAQNYSGADNFNYTIRNTQGLTASASVSVTVQPPPGPTANNDNATIVWNTQTPIPVTANDVDPAGMGLTVTITVQAGIGNAVVNGTSVEYTPQHNYVGADSFQYKITDINNNSATATVTLNVLPPPPVTIGNFTAQCTSDGRPCHICLSDHISNPIEISYTVNVSQPALAPDSSVTPPAIFGMCANDVIYSIDTGLAAMDSFKVTVSDPYHTQPSVATVTVDVAAP
ncbi:MAG TPA: Ig-like domain-containing protein, partial [Rudaea sp.]|nr:Ig-like domain-containing protein [Rudaea sp.]